ncbi:uncharacterized protein LOC133184122 isoform X2 [Saccostrea echinata]|uniref:uncharacterized protein LOC133184122 isoform X2 n=1 Tax=Saccostrea echinata TaxID=191078 RepID=UPI002A80A40C|nr:uncharacterized protein LOC133184122 isoform X2 [Saccostrea echinata]
MITIGLFLLFTETWAQISINTEGTWSDANLSCRLLGSNESGLFELSDEYAALVPSDGNMYWIAAIKKTTKPFKFDQCVSIDNFDDFNRKPLQDTYGCYEFCTGLLFAISSSQCVCTTSESNARNPLGCTDQILRKKETQMDLYIDRGFLEYSKIDTDSIQGEGDCAAVILKNGGGPGLTHEFLPCNTELPSICTGQQDTLKTESKNWTDAVLNCKGILKGSFDGFYPLSNPPSNNTKAWTGISRRSIKQWSNGIIDFITDPYECLAISKNNLAKSGVQIHVKNCNDSLPSLCEGSDFTTIVTTKLIPQSTPVPYPQTSPVLPAEQDTTPNDNLIPPIVGGAAAGVIIILLIVLIVVYRRFQQKNINKVNRHSSGVAYSIVDKSRQESATGLNGALVQTGTDDTYDHTVNSTSRQSVHNEQENMYDHTTAPQKEKSEDNFYDSTYRNSQKETIINDNEYGSVNPATGNDVYSHTNQVFSSGDTDVENYDSMKNLK